MKSTPMTALMGKTPATGLSCGTRTRSFIAPNAAGQGTAVPTAVPSAAAQAALAGVRSTDLPGSPARGAPV